MGSNGKRRREQLSEDGDLEGLIPQVPQALHCKSCGATKTPQWREGPLGPKTLCNACGVKWLRQLKKSREAVAPAKVHATRRVNRVSRASSEDAGPAASSEEWAAPWAADADEDDVATAADLLLLAGVDSASGQPSHEGTAAAGSSAQGTENESAMTIHLPIVKVEARPPTAGGQLLQRRVAVRRPVVMQPPPPVLQRILHHGPPLPLPIPEPLAAAASDQAEESGLVMAGGDHTTGSIDSNHALVAAPMPVPAAVTAAAGAPLPTGVPEHELAQLASLQAAVISAFAELQAADAARIATLECLAQTQHAADLARAQAVALAQRLQHELQSMGARLKPEGGGSEEALAGAPAVRSPIEQCAPQVQLAGH
mmetsp:Transcript_2565/g.6568  ORF Transcript_2565/g.6568 Transcript_2565/m.6568 type:complete len:369 (-) Transcript_2565:1636-2742(-)|eukprot:CAMPEP_0202866450 /NCGR_PEP_ID=MMETSP1391-20130828/7579_1 /ASSEMBLY_ACC=CAM_ASM_000867 /TAXON_ID=1034604 /ORGANISM="Chlamydomonas leiostraca, Strain SAG 11-49" /LENGTH=368 /DNA_ID=CAMNT_0049546393 /DNA_START=243 /DNA_END=1349 /DNA_ORIENTATION=+